MSQRHDSGRGRPGPAPASENLASDEPTQRQSSYVPPRLEPIGAWKALTLQQSVPITSADFLAGRLPVA